MIIFRYAFVDRTKREVMCPYISVRIQLEDRYHTSDFKEKFNIDLFSSKK